MSQNPAAVPTINPDIVGDDRWMTIHKRFVSETEEKEPEVVFIGDNMMAYLSYTDMWDTHFAPMHALNFGVGSDKTEYTLWRCLNGEMDNISPKAVVVLIGTNNTGCTAEQIAEGIDAIVDAIRSKQSQTEIIVLSLLPRGEKPNPIRERNMEVNKLVSKKISGKYKTQFVNIDPGFVQPNGNIRHQDMWDYLHLTNSGYLKAFEPVHEILLQILLNEDAEAEGAPAES